MQKNLFGKLRSYITSGNIHTALAVFGISFLLFSLGATFLGMLETKIELSEALTVSHNISSVSVRGDTLQRIYVVQDSSTGMVWVGIPGVNQIK